ncbi:hypothetical protein GOP47_0027653 [Adiantum capillus-veneris]|nr:hypothetical protein GOP47_0027653 [Adiantum capillus-veneris]
MAASQNGHTQIPDGKAKQTRDLWHYLRIVKAVVVLATLTGSASAILITMAPLTFFLLRYFSIYWSRKVIAFIFGRWLSMWPFFFEKVNKTQVIFSGHKVPAAERAIVICNHRTEVDWMYIWNLALRKKSVGSVKRWQVDELVFESMLSTFKGFKDQLWLVIFPEGTDYTEAKCEKSQKFAEENGLPRLHHVLLPRTKGVYACLAQLHDSVDAVYDLTIGYKNKCPLFLENALGTDPKEVHIHVKRIPISNIAVSEAGVSEWLMKEFARKDALLSHFYREGTFPDGQIIEESLSTILGVVNCCFILASSWASLFLFLAFPWFKLYTAFSCALLAASTYVNYKPVPFWRREDVTAPKEENGVKVHH